MASIRTKWVDAGKPRPGQKSVSTRPLEVLPDASVGKTTEQKLDEITVLRESGKISEDEYQVMRGKILDL